MVKRAMMLGLDGADPFVVKKMIKLGRLPNFKKLLEEGVAHTDYAMLGAFPSVTPPNWASLATGNWPRTHGVTCYNNHTLGKSLGIAESNWDSRRVQSEMIWETFGREGKRCLMVNYCEAWPPRTKDNNIYIDGTGVIPFMRCNADYQKMVWLEEGDFEIEEKIHAVKTSNTDCVVQGDQYEKMLGDKNVEDEFDPVVEMPYHIIAPGASGKAKDDNEADYIRTSLKFPENWERELPENALAATVPLNASMVRRYFVVTKDENGEYDEITIYQSRRANGKVLGTVKKGQGSGWIYDNYNKDGNIVKVAYQIRWLASGYEGKKIKLYVSYAVNLDDNKYFWPRDVGPNVYEEVGPALPFAKFGQTETHDWEAQNALLESFAENMQWHVDVSNWLFKQYPDWQLYYIHLHGIDLYNHWYINKTLPGSDSEYQKFEELLFKMYELNDQYVGEMMKQLDGETAIFVCSDHAAVPHSVGDKNGILGSIGGISLGVMGDLGYTKWHYGENGKPVIDWDQTKAICHRSSYIYVNVKGRDPEGIVEPEDYDKTVNQIIMDLYNYKHPQTGKRMVAFCMTRDEMEIVGMGGPHCGDILVQLVPTYCEEHANCPTTATNEGYSLNNLCMMVGAGFKKGELINRVIRVTDVVPTICHLLNVQMPCNVEGGVIWQALEGFEEKVYEK